MTAQPIHGSRDVATVTDRVSTAVEMRRDGHTWDQIAQACGYATRGSAHNAVMSILRERLDDNITDLRQWENQRLDADEKVVRAIIQDPDLDPTVRLRAIDTRTRLSARRSRLNGMDAPVQVALSAGVASDLADALAEAEAVFVRGEVLDVTDDRMEG